MTRPFRPAALLISALVVSPVQATDGLVSCHIHPPGSTPRNPVNIVGPFDSPASCEQARRERFGSAGRCHCAADFSPRWLPPVIESPPSDSPLS
jgi:hypothetical protein